MTDASPSGKRHAEAAHESAHRLRGMLWDLPRPASSDTPRVAVCGRKRIAQLVTIKGGGGRSVFGGVSTCGSVWTCPVCANKVAARRAVELQDTIRAWTQDHGGAVSMLTVNVSHTAGDSLASTWDAVSDLWRRHCQSRSWRVDSLAFGIKGWARVVEVTHGRRGWHPHLHVLLFTDRTLTADELDTLRARVFGRWQSAVRKHNEANGTRYRVVEFNKDGRAVAVDVRQATSVTSAYVGEYLTKFGYRPRSAAAGLAAEAMRGDLKTGRNGSRTPWEILQDLAARPGGPGGRDLALWLEWEAASVRRRQSGWSKGFRDSLDLDAVLTDQEAADREGHDLDTLAAFEPDQWRKLVNGLRASNPAVGRPLLVRMVTQAAALDPVAFRTWLRRMGVEYVHPRHLNRVTVLDETTGELTEVNTDRAPGAPVLDAFDQDDPRTRKAGKRYRAAGYRRQHLSPASEEAAYRADYRRSRGWDILAVNEG